MAPQYPTDDDFLKGEYEEEEEDRDEDEEDEDEDEEKSEVAITDLLKSLDALDAATDDLDSGNRQDYLEARYSAGTISKSEQAELGSLWAGTDFDAPTDDHIRKSLEDEDEDAGRLLDISPVLDGLVKSIDGFASSVLDSVQDEGARTRTVVLATADVQKSLGRAVLSLHRLVKAQDERMDGIESTPVPRRGVSTPSEVVKSRQPSTQVTGTNSDLTKAEVDRAFNLLVHKAAEAGDDEALDRLTLSAAGYEQTGRLDRNTEAAVMAVTRNTH